MSYQKILNARKKRASVTQALYSGGGVVQAFDNGGGATGEFMDWLGQAGQKIYNADNLRNRYTAQNPDITQANYAPAINNYVNTDVANNPSFAAGNNVGATQLDMGKSVFGQGRGGLYGQSGVAGQQNQFGVNALNDQNKVTNILGSTGYGGTLGQLGLANQANRAAGQVYGQQQGLINQLQGQALGQGPGSQYAQNMLQQATQNNIAQGAGQISSIKGLNPALAGKMIAENTAAQNQGAALQGSQLGLQQQLAAQQQLGGILGQSYGQNLGTANSAYGQVAGGLGQAAQNYGQIGQNLGQSGTQYGNIADVGIKTGAGIVNTNRGQDIDTGVGQGNLANTQGGNVIQGNTGQNTAITQGSLGSQGIQEKVQAGNTQTTSGILGGLIGAVGGVASSYLGSKAHGGLIPGEARYAGNDSRNDTVEAALSPGEIVLPREVVNHPNAPEMAAEFVRRTLAGKGPPPKFKKMANGGVVFDNPENNNPAKIDDIPNPPANISGGYSGGGRVRRYEDGGQAQSSSPITDWLLGAGGPGGSGSGDTTGQYDLATGMNRGAGAAVRAGGEATQGFVQPLTRQPGTPPSDGNQSSGQISPAGWMDAGANQAGNIQNANLNPFDVATGGAASAATSSGQSNAAPSGLLNNQGSYFNQAEAGLKDVMQANQQESDQRAYALRDSIADQQLAAQQIQNKQADISRRNEGLKQAILDQKIDPNRLWNDSSTGAKIAASIGVLLSGIGSGLTGQPNMAMQVIDKLTDRDIESQKMDLGKKKTLLSMNMEEYGRLDAAYAATRAQINASLEASMGLAAANSGNLRAKGAYEQGMAQVGAQRAQYEQRAAGLKYFYGGDPNGPASGVDTSRLQIGGQLGIIPQEQFKEAMKESGNYDELKNTLGAVKTSFDQTAKDATLGNVATSPLQSYRQYVATRDFNAEAIAKDVDGRVNPIAFKTAQDNWPAGGDSAETRAVKARNISNMIKAKKVNFPNLKSLHLVNRNDPILNLTSMGLQGEQTPQEMAGNNQ